MYSRVLVRRAEKKGHFRDGVVDGCLNATEHRAATVFPHEEVISKLRVIRLVWATQGLFAVQHKVVRSGNPADVLIDRRMPELSGELRQMVAAQLFDEKTRSHSRFSAA